MKIETKLKNIFLGPKAENYDIWEKYINIIFSDYIYWRKNYFPNDKIVIDKHTKNDNIAWIENLDYELNNTLNQLKAHFPFYSPRYMAHMLSEQTLPSVLGYFAGMLYNPNNVTDEAAPVTVDMEIEFGKQICKMLGYKSDKNNPTGWAHICSGGTIANLEALWVAREVQFMPLIIKEYFIRNNNIKFMIKLPNMVEQEKIDILEVNEKSLLSLKPNEKIYMLSRALKEIVDKKKWKNVKQEDKIKYALEEMNDFIKGSKYSVKNSGFVNVLSEVKLKPVLYVPESAHYSWEKAASILGYGSSSIKKIPINSKFRIDIDSLEKMIDDLEENEYIAAVITVAGTTEEGAVDPIHQVKFLRDKFEKKGISFWIHIDAAWGGYVRCLFNDNNYGDLDFSNEDWGMKKIYEEKLNQMRANANKRGKILQNLDENSLKCATIMDIKEDIIHLNIFNENANQDKKIERIAWNDLEVIKAYMAFKDADSITVDPHKLGYVPYPAGVVAFRNKNVTQFISQKASYISENKGLLEKIEIDDITSVGPYIIEGSKPGAAAVACWLSEKTIPLNLHNHGKIIKTTLLNAKKFKTYLTKFNTESGNFFIKNERIIKRPFKIVPLYDNIDTNIVCFVILPLEWNKKMDKNIKIIVDNNLSINKINEINEKIYRHFTIINDKDKKLPPHSQKFFLSKTRLSKEDYSYNSIRSVLEKMKIDENEYNNSGLFVLRATLMNPWYYDSSKEDMVGRKTDYFLEFIKELYSVAITIINETNF